MTPEQAIVRAERARALLEDPIFNEALQRLETDIFDAWSRTPIRDKDGQHELLLMIQTARKFKALFTQLVATGEIAKGDLNPSKLRQVLERFGVY